MNDYEKNECFVLKRYLEEILCEPLEIFKELIKWDENDNLVYDNLLRRLKYSHYSTAKEKGDRLEELVAFIIKKTFFFDIARNVQTGTNEIDEVIVLSDKGKQVLEQQKISRSILGIESDLFLGECKNYSKKLDVTYVGKFYSLLVSTDINFGIIFTIYGLTGKENEFHDAYGLVKVLRLIEKYKNNRELNILVFTISDYEKIGKGYSFFEIVKSKIIALKTSTNYDKLLEAFKHPNEEEFKRLSNLV